jgi:hypothetical protein
VATLTELGRAAQLDAATVDYCVRLLEFRADGLSHCHCSPKADAVREAASDMRRMLLKGEPIP